MQGRGIVYIILIGVLALMAYVGLRIGVRPLVWLSLVGILFLGYNFFAHREKE